VVEGVPDYPRWDGPLREGRSFAVVAREEARRAWRNNWSLFALLFSFIWGGLNLVLLQTGGERVHTIDTATRILDNLRWGSLAVAAVLAGPTFLEDAEAGALELYYSRAVTQRDYLGGKILAIVGLATIAIVGPILIYWGGSYLLLESHPDQWLRFPLKALVYGLGWAVVVSGLGMGLSCVSRSGRAATLILLGGFAIADIIIKNLLSGLTASDKAAVISPFAAASAQFEWLFETGGEAFPYWWGLVALGILGLAGWGLVAWRHPRVEGVEA
jgi:ABC-type transport system involved in multi-copper enzyme maturation permease subunit